MGVLGKIQSFRRLRSATYTMTLGFPNQSRFYDAMRRAVRFWGHDSAMEASFLPRGIVSILRAVSGGCNELPQPRATSTNAIIRLIVRRIAPMTPCLNE